MRAEGPAESGARVVAWTEGRQPYDGTIPARQFAASTCASLPDSAFLLR
jgi:hypothetical protein